MPEPNPALLDVCELTRTAADGTRLLSPTSFSVVANDVIACRGKTGAGKTVLLRCIAMLDRFEGQIRWRGNSVVPSAVPEYRAHVIYLAQRPVFGEGSVRSWLQEPFAWRVHRNKDFDEHQVVGYLEKLHRSERLLDAQLDALSGGESQLVAMIRAFLLQPTILLLDEPTSALDEETTRLFEGLVRQWLAESQGAVVWITHDPEQSNRVANRQFVVNQGTWSIDA